MLSRKVQCNLTNAKEYFEEHLCAGDYYSQGEQVTGNVVCAMFRHDTSRDLRRSGYELINRPRGDFEIKGVSQELCQRFSKRHEEIDEKTRELLTQKPHLAGGNIKDIREGIAQSQRLRKIKGITNAELRKLWMGQVSQSEKKTLNAIRTGVPAQSITPKNGRAIEAVA